MRYILLAILALCLSACATTKTETLTGPVARPVPRSIPTIIAQPMPSPPKAAEVTPPPAAPITPPDEDVYEDAGLFDDLPYWKDADHRPALRAFKRTCASFKKADQAKPLNPKRPEYGVYGDWLPACQTAMNTVNDPISARYFFERTFEPVTLSLKNTNMGLLTGYYEPEISVKTVADATYSEPILAKPKNKSVMMLPRAEISARSSRVIAYGRPTDVFFMQIQGSGRLNFDDGRVMRAAYAANNGHKYKSIGGVLIRRGELTKDTASKQSIEKWMNRAGSVKARDLMNQNPRYIFFTEQSILPGEGPAGAMRVPLTEMGSMAVDPRYHPYGTLVWLNTKLPVKKGDYRGKETGILVNAQDTGSAIKGPLRGDLFFGPGDKAGGLAGVMKHPVQMTILLPTDLAIRRMRVS